MNWIMEQIDGKIYFLHNLEPASEGYSYILKDGALVESPESYFKSDLPPEIRNPEKPLAYSFYNLEDYGIKFLLDNLDKMPFSIEDEVINLLVLRDPLNFIASRVKTYRKADTLSLISEVFLNNYFEWCEVAIQKVAPIDGLRLISYPDWVHSKEYRSDLSRSLGLTFDDKGYLDVVEESSFDQFEYKGKADQMNLLQRYETMVADDIFKGIVTQYQQKIDEVNSVLFSGFNFPAVSKLFSNLK